MIPRYLRSYEDQEPRSSEPRPLASIRGPRWREMRVACSISSAEQRCESMFQESAPHFPMTATLVGLGMAFKTLRANKFSRATWIGKGI